MENIQNKNEVSEQGKNHCDSSNDHLGHMMWMMVICCGFPLILILLGINLAGPIRWLVLLTMLVFCLAHFFLMKKNHKKHDSRE